MKFQRQHFLFSYFMMQSVDPPEVRTHNLLHGSPMLSHLSHLCAVIVFSFSWDHYKSQEIKTIFMEGQIKSAVVSLRIVCNERATGVALETVLWYFLYRLISFGSLAILSPSFSNLYQSKNQCWILKVLCLMSYLWDFGRNFPDNGWVMTL